MGNRKPKGNQKWKAKCIIIADEFQQAASRLLNRATNTDIVAETVASVMNVSAHLTDSEEIKIVKAEDLNRDIRDIVASMELTTTNGTAILQTLLLRERHHQGLFKLEQTGEYKAIPEKLMNNINGFFSGNTSASFVEFTHGARLYRVTMRESGVYELMAYSKKGSWEVRGMMKGLRG